jgi:hypothetical protein
MGLAKTFTNSIVREVGRNYGKAISNSLLGDKHSTPHRIVGNKAIDRKRGRVYQNDLDKAIQKFEIKGHQATFNQALNIHSEYFQLVDEANSDGSIDLNEIVFLVKSSRIAIPALERAKSALIDHSKPDLANKVEDKIIDLSDFIKTLNESLDVNELPEVKFNPLAVLFGILSLFGIDRIYFSPKRVKSFVFAFLGLSPYIISYYLTINSMELDDEATPLYFSLLMIVGGTMPLWYTLWYNRKNDGGYWGYRRNKKRQKSINKLAVELKSLLEEYTASL